MLRRLEELRELLLCRGYRKGVINVAFARAKELDRTETLKKVERKDSGPNRVKFVIEYDPRLPHISKILNQQWKVMIETD